MQHVQSRPGWPRTIRTSMTDIDPTVDYYQCLGVPSGASAEEIKRAYRAIAKTHHPDFTGGDFAKETKFKLAAVAYGVLGDAAKRVQYDAARRGHVRREQGSGSGRYPASSRASAGSGELFDLSSLVNEFLGGDLLNNLGGIAQEVAAAAVPNDADATDTSSAKSKSRQRSQKRRAARVKTTAGAATRSVMACDGGTLDVDDLDVRSEIKVSLISAVLGGKHHVATLGGYVDVVIPPGCPGGSRLRLAGRGLSSEGEVGDHYVLIRVVIPRAADARGIKDARAELLRILDALDDAEEAK